MRFTNNLSLNEIEGIQKQLLSYYKFVNEYLKSHPLAALEDEICNLRQSMSMGPPTPWSVDDINRDHYYVRHAGPDIKAMQFFYEKHEEFIDNFQKLKKLKRYFYQDFYIENFNRIEQKIMNSELGVPFVRVGLL